MTDTIEDNGLPLTGQAAADPLACFVPSPKEQEGVQIDVEHPATGKVLMQFQVARFGGQNNAQIIREERKLKAKLTQGQRRALDAGSADPAIAQRLNRMTFVRVSLKGWTMIDPALASRWGAFTAEKADELFEAYPLVYDLVSEKAMDEEVYANDALKDALGNSSGD